MIDRQNSPSPWSQTMSRINSQSPDNNNESTSSAKLQDDNYVPRKRNNSLIPIELMMNNNSEGGIECAALATVFGVPEYIESRVFWERQQKQTNPLRPNSDRYGYVSVNSISIASRPISSSFKEEEADPLSSQRLQSKYFISSYIDSMLDHVGSNVDPLMINTPSNSPTPTPTKSFSLPRIPTVSKFNDFLIEDENGIDIMFPANPSSILLHSSTPMIRADSLSSSVHSGYTLPAVIANTESQVVVGTPEVFDLIMSDQDERFIIWGPDPILLSSSMATTSFERPSTYATLYNSQHRRPELKGFSSNTTSTLTRTRSSRRWLSRETDHGSVLLKKAFGLSKKKKDIVQDMHIPDDLPKVIEAATVHKLIEKLTSTLDYTLMTDFFLTYRDFLNSEDLCQLLISRFYWALQNQDESRKIVRIRTFVVLRHWLNNYFVHDFIGNRALRTILTNFLNQLARHPLVRESPRDQRIVKILKRVVRRLKKLYYNRSSEASRVKVILPPPPTAEQEHMSEIVRQKLSSRRKEHHGNMAVQDARNAAVVVVGSLTMKSASMIDSGLEDSLKTSSIHHKTLHDMKPLVETSSVMSVDSLDSDISAGDTIHNDSEIVNVEQYHEHLPVAEDTEHDRDWIKEQKETLEYFNQVSSDPIDQKQMISDSTTSGASTPTTPNQSDINNITLPTDSNDEPIPVDGLAKKLSRKSIERRRSEKELHKPKVTKAPESFAAIRYESTQVMSTVVEAPVSKKRLSRVLSKVFHKNQPIETRIDAPIDEKIPIVAQQHEAQPRNSSQLVSLIAQRLRHDSMEGSKCDCAKCLDGSDSGTPNQRSSVLFAEPQSETHIKKGPVYLGHLQARNMIHNSKNEDIDDDDDSSSHSEKSIQTEAQASSSRANRLSFLSEHIPRSKLIELDVVPSRNERCFIMLYRTSRLAKQFCFIERDVLAKVGWEELIHCKWTKMDDGGEDEHVLNKEEQGVNQVIQRFNVVCQWVSFEIVRTRNINERVKLIEKFIRLAKKCKMFSNYATLVQILLGLQCPAVARLEKTWSKVSPKCQKQLAKLTEFTSPMKNWKNIRDSMTQVAEEYGNSPSEVQVELPGTSSSPKKFKKTTKIKMPFGGCIPFLGIYLSDLVFNSEKPRYLSPTTEHQRIYMANHTKNLPACLDEPLVNFRKHRVIATVIKRVLTFQNLATRYAFEEDPELLEKCKYLKGLDAVRTRELSASIE